MHELSVLSQVIKTMSSREITTLVESRHDDVKRSIVRLAEKGVFDIPPLAGYLDSMGRAGQTEYLLDKRSSLIVVAQLCPEFTARIIDRWQELEAHAVVSPLPNFADPVAAARAWADEREAVQTANAALALAAPKVAFVERYVAATGLKGFREVCKLLKANEARFREFVIEGKIMYRLGGSLTAHQNQIDAGRFEVRTGVAETEHAFTTTKFTAKGIDWIAGEWAKHQLRVEVAA